MNSHRQVFSSHALRRHLSAITIRAAFLLVSHADHEPLSKSASQGSRPYSMNNWKNPLFRSCFCKGVRSCVAKHTGRPAPRVWLPFQRCIALPTSADYFIHPRSWVSPFEVSFRTDDREMISHFPSALTLSCKTSSA